MQTKNREHPDFKLTYELALIEHLGLNLYSEPEAALSELIANAYDADSPGVQVTLPLNTPLGLHGQTIVVEDQGHGMTYEEARDFFLRIGRNRRRHSRSSRSGQRKVIGKKGIGKLAGFGIANRILVSTVSSGKLTEFALEFDALQRAPVVAAGSTAEDGAESPDAVREYQPELIHANSATTRTDGTRIELSHLRQLDALSLEDFKLRLARRFAVFGDQFKVEIASTANGEKTSIARFDVDAQFRFPEAGWGQEEIVTPSGTHQVRYWVAFTKATIKESAVRGISVIANGKSIQEPFDFRLTGGTTGQFGLQYMTGEVIADWIDDSAVDVLASDRASVRWSDPSAAVLLNWGREKVRQCLERWGTLRAAKTIASLKTTRPDIYKQIEAYKGEARRELEKVVDRVASTMSTLGEERTQEVIASIVSAFGHEHVQNVLRRVTTATDGLDLFVAALAEWDAIDAVLTFQDLSVKLEAVKTLGVLVHGGATEVRSKSGQMSLAEHLAANPWLLDPSHREMQHEIAIDTFLAIQYGYKADKTKGKVRADFIALYNADRVRLIEIKSAKAPLDLRGVTNFIDYKNKISTFEAQRQRPRRVEALLVYNGKRSSDAEGTFTELLKNGDYQVQTWQELLDKNVMLYKEQLTRVRERNPTDPRIQVLWSAYQGRDGAATGRAARLKSAKKK